MGALWPVAAICMILAGCASRPTTPAPRPSSSILVSANVDVSQSYAAQDEVSAASDPADPSILLAGSNSLQESSVRVYGSSDAGLHWSTALLPLPSVAKGLGAVDQWAAIGPGHRQAMSYLAFGQTPQRQGSELTGLAVFVATRGGPGASWLAPSAPVDGLPPAGAYDDKAALAADNSPASPYHGRLYVAWTRWVGQDGWLLVSHSSDWGQTWSPPVVLRRQGNNWGAALALAPDGTVTAAWAGSDQLWISRSRDGGLQFSPPLAFGDCPAPMAGCTQGATIPAQSDAGVRANPVLVEVPPIGVQSGQVLALYASGDGAPTPHIGIEEARFDAASLHPLGSPASVLLGAADTDQFLPAAAFDPSRRTLWVCAYVSLARAPVEARYTCTASLDAGHTFLPPIAAASVSSNEEQPGAFRHYIGRQYGDYTALVAAGGVAHAFWTDSRDLASAGEEIFTATLTAVLSSGERA